MKNAVVWFRKNLRINDNPTLNRAVKMGFQIIPVFLIDDIELGLGFGGVPKFGAHRATFLLEGLTELNKLLIEKGSKGLSFLAANSVEKLVNLAVANKCEFIFATADWGSEETETLERVTLEAKKQGIKTVVEDPTYLFDAENLPFTIPRLPDVFTEFRKKVEKECTVQAPKECPQRILSPEEYQPIWDKLKTLKQDLFQETKISVQPDFKLKGGPIEGQARIQHYFYDTNGISTYKETRNGLLGLDYSSKLSPYLALGFLSPREVYAEVTKYEKSRISNQSTYWLKFELLWREYFYWVARKYGNLLFKQNGLRPLNGKKKEKIFPDELQRFSLWADGKTNEPFVNANMKELLATGFMSNRGRQNVASYLVKDLKVDWRIGAAWFEYLLIDYDVCSNYGNWAYVAGVGNDPREDRYFNIAKQASMYDPEGLYVKKWLGN